MISDADRVKNPEPEEAYEPETLESLQELQDCLCRAAGIFAVCTDESERALTRMSGGAGETEKIQEILRQLHVAAVFRRVVESGLEEQTIEDIPAAAMKVAVISVKMDGRPVLNWLLCGILDDDGDFGGKSKITDDIYTRTTEEKFSGSADLVRLASHCIVKILSETASARREMGENRKAKADMEKALKERECMTDIMKLLDSDESFEAIVEAALRLTGEFAGISNGFVLRINQDMSTVDCLGEWHIPSGEELFLQIRHIGRPAFLHYSEKPVVISDEAKISLDMEDALAVYHIQSIVMMPIFIQSVPAMYVCYAERRHKRRWELADIKFFNDVTRILQSVFTRRIQKNSITSSYASLVAILNHVGSAIYVRDSQTDEILFANDVLKENFREEHESGRLECLFGRGAASAHGVLAGRSEIYDGEKKKWYDLCSTDIQWVDGRKVALQAIYDITDKKEYQRKIEHQANNDFLTGLYNRMCCEKDLKMYVEEADRRGINGCVLYLDLDDFKHINDGLGHQYGDILLKAIAHSLQRIPEIHNTCYRMGGDEFVIIIPEQKHPELERVLEQIRDIFNKPWFLKGSDYYCTMSMGIVNFPDEGNSVTELIKKADIAMYEAKNSGKNRIALYEETKGDFSHRRLDMEKNMRAAAGDGYREFEVYYQPVVDVRRQDNPCVGAEALIRWNSEKLGFVGPGEFIPLAEYLGLINPIGDHVLKKACLECKSWNESGHPYYKVNVNLSVVQLLQPDIVDKVASIIREVGINPRNLTLEVTEGLAINDMERMKSILEKIRKLGVRIALDDFGTGYSSLNHIREIPLDVIKVDQSFVKDLAKDPFSQSFIKMVAELAHAIGVKICVEGIETKDQLQVLNDMRVRMVQGYYFGKPMTAGQFRRKYVDGAMDRLEIKS